MERKKASAFTVVPRLVRPHVKAAFRTVFVALRADLRQHPGGASALADACGVNAVVLCNKLNPDQPDHAPTAEQLLTVIEQGACTRTVAAIAALVGQTAIDVPLGDASPQSVVAAFMGLIAEAGKLTAQGAADLADGHLSATERECQAAMLDVLIPAAVQYRALLRS